jgi:hypothetical protein
VRPLVEKRLEEEILIHRRGHIHAGITGGAFLYKTLLALDRQDLLFTMARKEEYPGWGDMLRHGATTMYESWDKDNSLCHSSYLYIGTWFSRSGRIKTNRLSGLKHFIVKPGLVNPSSNGSSPTMIALWTDCQQLSIDTNNVLTVDVTIRRIRRPRCFHQADEKRVREGRPLVDSDVERGTEGGALMPASSRHQFQLFGCSTQAVRMSGRAQNTLDSL